MHGKAFSLGALRDLGDPGELEYSPKSAVDALNQLGYTANFGRLKARKISPEHCPLISFTLAKDAVLVEFSEERRLFKLTNVATAEPPVYLKRSELKKHLLRRVIGAFRSVQ